MELQGKDKVVEGTFPYSLGSGSGIDAWNLLGCLSLLAVLEEPLLVDEIRAWASAHYSLDP